MQEPLSEPQEEGDSENSGDGLGVALPMSESFRCRLLLEITDVIVRARNLTDLLRELAPRVLSLAGCDFLTFSLYDKHQNSLPTHYWKRNQEGRELGTFSVEECVGGWVWKHQEPIVIPDIVHEQRFPRCLDALRQLGVRSFTALPVNTEQNYGVLGLGKGVPEILEPQEMEFLFRIAQLVALALENQEKRRTERQQEERLQMLLETSNTLAQSKLDLEELSPQISACIQGIVPHDLALIAVPDEDGQTVRICALEPSARAISCPGLRGPKTKCLSLEIGGGEAKLFQRKEMEALASSYPVVGRALNAGFQAICAVDLSTAHGSVGVLFLASKREQAFQDSDLELLKPAAAQVALVVENALTQSALRREKERLETLLQISTTMVGVGFNLQELFSQVASSIRRLIPNDSAVVVLFDEASQLVRMHAFDPVLYYPIQAGETMPISESLSGQIAAGEARLFSRDDLEAIAPRCEAVRKLLEVGAQSLCAVPLATAKGRVGVLHLMSKQQDAFHPSDLELLRPLAGEVALLVENAMTLQALSGEKERLQMLLEISTTLASSLDFKELFPAIAASVRKVVQHDHAAVSVYDEALQELRVYALDSASIELNGDSAAVICPANSPAEHCFRSREARIYNRADLREAGLVLMPPFANQGVQSMCCIPLMTGKGAIGTLSLASERDGTFVARDLELLTQVAGQVAIALENARAYREIARLKDRLAREKRYLEEEIHREMQDDEIVGNSPALKRVLDYAAIVASTDSTVLITGETGTGKERVALAIHSMSRRCDRSFIKLNCAAIPTGLLESELFGHEKGAFTGAVSQKMGRLELADKGTLFLDEIGDIPLELQPKLLRVLQDHEFERLGGTRTIRVDVRLIAATNRDLARAVAEEQFRTDLFYRLRVFPLHLPALRVRREDIPLLVRHFVERCGARMNKHIEFIPDEAIEAMLKWHWPGNIRELENFIERSVILSEGNVLRPPLAELREEISRQQSHPDGTLRDKEREHIIAILRRTSGVLSGPSGAAARLGLKRTTLQYKMQKLGITRMDYLD